MPAVLVAAIALSTLLLVFARPRAANGPEGQPSTVAGEAWTPPPANAATEAVSLTIDFGNGSRRSFDLPWTAGMTVEDLLKLARETRPGLQFTQQGADKLAMLTSLDGVQSGAADGRYWLYEVNGQSGEVSFAVQPLAAGDRVLWVFKRPE
jgi:hypothetical protein